MALEQTVPYLPFGESASQLKIDTFGAHAVGQPMLSVEQHIPYRTEPMEDRFGGEVIIPIGAGDLPRALVAFQS